MKIVFCLTLMACSVIQAQPAKVIIDAKHSNEDEIAPFEKWIELYNHKIGLFGGIDVNILTLNSYEANSQHLQKFTVNLQLNLEPWAYGSNEIY